MDGSNSIIIVVTCLLVLYILSSKSNIQTRVTSISNSNKQRIGMYVLDNEIQYINTPRYTLIKDRPQTLHPFMLKFNSPYANPVDLKANEVSKKSPYFINCYNDDQSRKKRVLPKYLGKMNVSDCSVKSKKLGYNVFGMQNADAVGYGQAECWTGNDISFNRHGVASDCGLYGDMTLGGGNSHAVYSYIR
jgi:hypothetical protein